MTTPQDPVAADEARYVVARLAMMDARDLANRAIAHAIELRAIGGEVADAAAEIFDHKAAKFRALERHYADLAGVADE